VKPENILLATPGSYPRVLIADFGLARDHAWQATAHIVGTVSYLPPEAVQALARKNATYVGPPADCWSLGVVIYVMLRLARSALVQRGFTDCATAAVSILSTTTVLTQNAQLHTNVTIMVATTRRGIPMTWWGDESCRNPYTLKTLVGKNFLKVRPTFSITDSGD